MQQIRVQEKFMYLNQEVTSIEYEGEYLSQSIVERCFIYEKTTYIDKQRTGNGFTHWFLKLKPSRPSQANILIAPNRKVIEDKRRSYLNNTDKKKPRTGFIWGSELSDKMVFSQYDNFVIVMDSFMDKIEWLSTKEHLIDKIMVDESHSVLIQSEFRNPLKNVAEKLEKYFPKQAKAFVTATPMLYQPLDILIHKPFKEFKTIHITQNQNKAIKRAINLIKKGGKVIIATHNKAIINKLKKASNELNANYKIGKSLLEGLNEIVLINHNEESNLVIVSSAGFEGWDIPKEVGEFNVFFFEDRANKHETFFFQNVLQAIGRARGGAQYIEWCRAEIKGGRASYPIEELRSKIKSTRISIEKKFTDKNYRGIQKFGELVTNEEGFTIDVKFNEEAYYLYKELEEADNNGIHIYDEYAKMRGFEFKHLNEGSSRIENKRIGGSYKSKIELLIKNRKVSQSNELFQNVRMDTYPKEGNKQYLNSFEKYLRLKYFAKQNDNNEH